jgi:hypothetical protein
MPIHKGKDKSRGFFYQYGHRGRKYYYTNRASENWALKQARKQARAIRMNGYVEH